jgi:ABC-type glycerol-3-phosphate transport system substrate-binding protein
MNAFGGVNSEFANGKAAMMLFGRWPQGVSRQIPNISLVVVAPPMDKGAPISFSGVVCALPQHPKNQILPLNT